MKQIALAAFFLALFSANALAQYDDSDTTITTTTTTTPITTTVPTSSTTLPVTTTIQPNATVITTPAVNTTSAGVVTNPPVITRQVIVTPTPAVSSDKLVPIPTGYVNCFSVSAGWYNDVWVAEHQVCQYNNTLATPVAGSSTSIQGKTWVAGYWTCPKYNSSGECTSWVWKPGRWLQTLDVY